MGKAKRVNKAYSYLHNLLHLLCYNCHIISKEEYEVLWQSVQDDQGVFRIALCGKKDDKALALKTIEQKRMAWRMQPHGLP